MKKVKNTIRAYINKNLEHADQFNNISTRLNLHKIQKKEKYNYMKLSKALKFVVPILLIAIIAIVVVSSMKPHVEEPKDPVAVVQMDVNPSISLVVDEDNKVLSVYGENDEGKMIINDEEIVGLKLSAALDKIITIEVETGYLVKENDESKKIAISIEAETGEIAENIKTNIEANVQKICDELKINEKLEVEKNNTKEILVNRAIELDPTLTTEQANEMTNKQLIAYIKGCQLELINIPTEEIENLYNRVKQQKVQLVEKEETKAVIDKLDEGYQTIKSGYETLYQSLINAQQTINDKYVEMFIAEDSAYNKAINEYQRCKQEILKLENEISQIESAVEKAVKTQVLTAQKLVLESANVAIETAKVAADAIIEGLNYGINLAIENLDNYINELPEEIKTNITSALTNLEQKINDAKDNAFAEFENNYKDEIKAAYDNTKQYKQQLIEQLKSVN